jgi:hypothetical protein
MPSLEEIEQMERKRSQALEALEYVISESDKSVKCQRCGIAVPIVGKMSRPKNDKLSSCKRGKGLWRIIRIFVVKKTWKQ